MASDVLKYHCTRSKCVASDVLKYHCTIVLEYRCARSAEHLSADGMHGPGGLLVFLSVLQGSHFRNVP